jgi:hypothetical protein
MPKERQQKAGKMPAMYKAKQELTGNDICAPVYHCGIFGTIGEGSLQAERRIGSGRTKGSEEIDDSQ